MVSSGCAGSAGVKAAPPFVLPLGLLVPYPMCAPNFAYDPMCLFQIMKLLWTLGAPDAGSSFSVRQVSHSFYFLHQHCLNLLLLLCAVLG